MQNDKGTKELMFAGEGSDQEEGEEQGRNCNEMAELKHCPWSVEDGDDDGDDGDDDAVFISIDTPKDQNVGQRRSIKAVFGHVLGFGRKPANKSQINPKKPSPINELWKIDHVLDYNDAFNKYEAGLKAGWTDAKLLDMIAAIRRRRRLVVDDEDREADHEEKGEKPTE